MPLRVRLELLWRMLGAVFYMGSTSVIIAQKSYARLRRARTLAVAAHLLFLLCVIGTDLLVVSGYRPTHPAVLAGAIIAVLLAFLMVVRLRLLYVELADLRTADIGLFQNAAGPIWRLAARLGWALAVLKAKPRYSLAVLRLATSRPVRYQTRADYRSLLMWDLAFHVLLSQRRAYNWPMHLAVCMQLASWWAFVATIVAIATKHLLPHAVLCASAVILLAISSLACVSWAFHTQRETLKQVRIEVKDILQAEG